MRNSVDTNYETRRGNFISEYFGITQDLNTQDFIYYSKGDLIHECINKFQTEWNVAKINSNGKCESEIFFLPQLLISRIYACRFEIT
jgi:hypothetical protein